MKNKIIKKLLAVFLLSLAATASISTAQAELIDLSDPEHKIIYTIHESNWIVKPNFQQASQRASDYFKTAEMKFTFVADEEGRISGIQVIESSGSELIDREFVRQLSKGLLKPLVTQGRSVKQRFTLPVKIIVQQHR